MGPAFLIKEYGPKELVQQSVYNNIMVPEFKPGFHYDISIIKHSDMHEEDARKARINTVGTR